ncbi:PAS domain-containing hybrid sensor histidine kinase/response regulator [Nibricoccus aquaticus]|uniref:PAS domain-containing hybrid sensor histidine kinase/response regulator n=1 Tax=Nibricoccus aquaticus TaxID=2576891 RepID=UPI0010FEED3C|nr:ATP-binding protein [Nibricoccus aquaticus]
MSELFTTPPTRSAEPSRHLQSPALFTLDASGVIVSASAGAENFWQAEAAQLAGRAFVDLFRFEVGNAPDAARHSLQWELFLATALNRAITCAARLADSSSCDVVVRVEENRGEAGGYFAWVDDPGRRREAIPPMLVDSGLALLADQGSVGFFDLNFKAGQIYYSPAWKRLLGYTDTELVNTYDSWLRLLHPEDSAAAPDRVANRRADGIRSFSVEVRMKHRRGHYVWVNCLGAQVFGLSGRLERVTGLQIDISERKEHEDQTYANEDRFHRLTDGGCMAAFDLDFTTHRHWFSPAWRQLAGGFGTDGEDGLASFLAALPPAEASRGAKAFFLNPAPGKDAYADVVRLRGADSRAVPALISAHRQLSRTGELLRVVGFCCALPGSLDALSDNPIPPSLIGDALDALSEGLIIADQRGKVVYLNANAQRLTGQPLETARSRHVSEVFALVNRENGQPAPDALDGALTGAVHPPLCIDHALISTTADAARPIVWSIRQVWTPEGGIAGLVLVFRDPEEMTLTPEELLKTNRLETLGVVAGGLAHDFNNLLTTILGGISHAKDNHDSTFLPDSERACMAAKALTKQLLAVAKGGSASSARQTISPVEILRDAVRLAHAGANAEIRIEAEETLPLLSVDRGQMLQVFQNLIINALQALPLHGGRILLRAGAVTMIEDAELALPAGEYIEFSVSDNGSGIPAEVLERIFEPFFTTKKNGTGLGLPTVRNIVLRHGGEVRVHSAQDEGTQFIILLPQAPKAVEVVETRHTPALRFGTGRILLMDDDADICRLAGGMLGSLDYKYDTARNGEEAIALYKRYLNIGRPYDAIILDLTVVGGMGGEETFRELHALDPDLCAIACTGYDSEEMAAELLAQGFRGYLSKPFRVADLGKSLKKALAARSATA